MDPNSQNTPLFLSQQQQTLSSLIAAANGSITSLSQLNGLVNLPSDLDKKVSSEFSIVISGGYET